MICYYLRVDIEGLDAPVRDYIHSLEKQVSLLVEQLALMKYKRFGRSSEEMQPGLLLPFGEGEVAPIPPAEAESSIAVPAHERKKPGRKPIDPRIPRTETVVDIAEEEKLCGCGKTLVKIGEERCEKLHHIIEKYFVEVIVRPYWACKHCEGSGDEDKSPVRIAPVPPAIIPKGMATPDLLASIAVNKFCDHLPFYRQEKRLERHGVSISRNDMANWIIAASQAVMPVFERLLDRCRKAPIINMDETSMTVMGEPGKANASKSYMWLMRAGPPEEPSFTYHYRPSHGADEARELLGDFAGFLQTDGLGVYPAAIAGKPIIHVGCWAHARRKFFDAQKANPKSEAAQAGMAWIGQLYSVERELRKRRDERNLDARSFMDERRDRIAPILSEFKRWLDQESLAILPSSLAGKAVAYTLGQWDKLLRYLEHPDLTPDNNLAENAIRPFVLGRKNWLICGSPDGATASCVIYSLIETAKANGLNAFSYLSKLFYFAPLAKSDADWDRLMPFKSAFDTLPGYTVNVPEGLY